MFAYRHAFHAGNHADVLKHLVLVQLLQHLNQKEKGYRVIDTHAGAGAYSLRSEEAHKKLEWLDGIGKIWERKDLPKGVAAYLDQVEAFNGPGVLKNVPGSPSLIRQMLRPQDELHAYEVHPTDLRALEKLMAEHKSVKVHLSDGFASLKAMLPPPTRRGLLLIDPPYELKTDYARTLAAVREALTRFPDCVVAVWIPQLQLLDAQQLPQRLRNAVKGLAKKGWLDAQLTVNPAQGGGFGLMGSHMFVVNPPHTLGTMLAEELPWLAQAMGQFEGAKGSLQAGN
ncbi:23S rRNA (adenine2030-N6)-methyltransferase [Inhella inkyongensis]|uniref:Ribosomal RNA large subunit methyltransferase J n=1 Tax=Inhella inkyongensis TaxID=392593 RepID=A0A840S424_9BURK|nr:23S rRNA (adenine(2030)-N(6))-methyltransferase RlmJ [Inhella inkyongensis]MBB5203401.1 23S rRNA (adenine2030-N6)-methyltransferase [Inhella inkyongensis]